MANMLAHIVNRSTGLDMPHASTVVRVLPFAILASFIVIALVVL